MTVYIWIRGLTKPMPQNLDAILSRRSIRRYRTDTVDKVSIERLIQAAISAPSGGNLQPWHFVVVENREMLGSIRDLIVKGIQDLPHTLGDSSEDEVKHLQERYRKFSLFFFDAPITVFVFYSPAESAIAKHFKHQGLGPDGVEHATGNVEVQSTAAAIENLLLAVHEMGLGACWMNPPFFVREEMTKMLGMAPPWRLLAMIPIGKPAETPAGTQRKPVREVTTFID
jgi:nitroreductase